ncbi:BrnT family toxin [Zhongshania aliphaticivorans]|uniref:BrnT family toxin n=1 Tax=Zhongshania aliphaticivorans TaxID=1470434 RepID=UPI0039C8F20A
MYSFEFDPKKSKSNFEKHGIDFVDAQAIWQDTDFIEIMAKSDDEPRALVVGMIDGKHWSAIITYRTDRIGIISVRRSRNSEVVLYES